MSPREEAEWKADWAAMNAKARREEGRRVAASLPSEPGDADDDARIAAILSEFDDLMSPALVADSDSPLGDIEEALADLDREDAERAHVELEAIREALKARAAERRDRLKARKIEDKRERSEKAWALSPEIAAERTERRAAYMRHISKGAPRELRRHTSPAAVDDLMAWWTAIAQVRASGRGVKVRFVVEARQKIKHGKSGDDGRYALDPGLSVGAVRKMCERMLVLVEKLEAEGGPWHKFRT